MCEKYVDSYRGLRWRDQVRCRVAIQQGIRVVHGFQPLSRCRLLENLQRCSNEQGSEPTDLTVHKGLPKPTTACRRLDTARNCASSSIRICCSKTRCGPRRERGTTCSQSHQMISFAPAGERSPTSSGNLILSESPAASDDETARNQQRCKKKKCFELASGVG